MAGRMKSRVKAWAQKAVDHFHKRVDELVKHGRILSQSRRYALEPLEPIYLDDRQQKKHYAPVPHYRAHLVNRNKYDSKTCPRPREAAKAEARTFRDLPTSFGDNHHPQAWATDYKG